MLCGKCGAQVGDDFKFCPECGTPMPVVRKAAEKALNQGEEPLEKVKAEAAEAIGEVKEAVEEAKDDLREIGAEVKEELSDVAEKEEVKEDPSLLFYGTKTGVRSSSRPGARPLR